MFKVEIIQCEHEKNKHSDVWRTNQVIIIPILILELLCLVGPLRCCEAEAGVEVGGF